LCGIASFAKASATQTAAGEELGMREHSYYEVINHDNPFNQSVKSDFNL